MSYTSKKYQPRSLVWSRQEMRRSVKVKKTRGLEIKDVRRFPMNKNQKEYNYLWHQGWNQSICGSNLLYFLNVNLEVENPPAYMVTVVHIKKKEKLRTEICAVLGVDGEFMTLFFLPTASYHLSYAMRFCALEKGYTRNKLKHYKIVQTRFCRTEFLLPVWEMEENKMCVLSSRRWKNKDEKHRRKTLSCWPVQQRGRCWTGPGGPGSVLYTGSLSFTHTHTHSWSGSVGENADVGHLGKNPGSHCGTQEVQTRRYWLNLKRWHHTWHHDKHSDPEPEPQTDSPGESITFFLNGKF